MKLHVNSAGNQRIGAIEETQVYGCEAIERNAQHVEDRVDMLLHAAAFGADGDAFAFEVSNGLYRRAGKFDETHWPGIGGRHHAQSDLLGERRYSVLGPANPIGRHEAKLEIAAIELLGIMNARVAGLHDTVVVVTMGTIKKLGERLTLCVKRPAEFRSANSYHHRIFASSLSRSLCDCLHSYFFEFRFWFLGRRSILEPSSSILDPKLCLPSLFLH